MNCLMVQGTTSDAGKSTLVAGLARLLKRRGVKLAPFKPQNMALNSAVTADGGEIGRAQALQAMAAGLAPHTDMNPVLLKPSSDLGAQVIIQGRVAGNMRAQNYHDYKRTARQAVLESFSRLQNQYPLVLVEGAGSPAEINLRDNDIANMGFAEAVDCPVILVADIDRGGVFAHLVGTLALLSASEQARIQGFVINRFRGDLALLQPGLDWLEKHTGKPVLGVVPYLHDLYLDAEDAVADQQPQTQGRIRIVVPRLPRISNHTDFDALRLHPQVDLHYVAIGDALPACDLVILPGSKNVRADLQALRACRWPDQLRRHLRYGGRLLGICGGLQMLGRVIDDPQGVEDTPGRAEGLGLLDFATQLRPGKTLRNVRGFFELGGTRAAFTGYEIHCGVSEGAAFKRAVFAVEDPPEGLSDQGALSEDGQILATYIHGLFDHPQALQSLLRWAGGGQADWAQFDLQAHRQAQLDRLADTLEQHLDAGWLAQLEGG